MEVWKWLVLWSTAAVCCHGHVCIYDKIAKETIIPRVVGTRHFSRLPQTQATPYQGIRIAPLFMELEGDSGPMPEETNEMLQDVVDYMNTALMVPEKTYDPGLRIEPCFATWAVGRAEGKCAVPAPSDLKCGIVPVPEEHIGVTQVCDPMNLFCVTVGPDGPGVQDADYILYVTYTEENCRSEEYGTTLAYGGACFLSSDENYRPMAGMINLCPGATEAAIGDASSRSDEAGQIYLHTVLTHEIFHALGFGLFNYYVDENGDRDSPISYLTEDHRRIPIMDSPIVKEVGREYYDCSDLQGVPLEDEGGEGSALAHWEMRALYGEVMVAALDPWFASEATISNFTLAALEDSGWYKANYEATSELFWGKGQGCEFPLSKCPAPYNCSTKGEPGCYFDNTAVGTCAEYSFMNGCKIISPYYKNPATGEFEPGLCEKNQTCVTDGSPKCI